MCLDKCVGFMVEGFNQLSSSVMFSEYTREGGEAERKKFCQDFRYQHFLQKPSAGARSLESGFGDLKNKKILCNDHDKQPECVCKFYFLKSAWISKQSKGLFCHTKCYKWAKVLANMSVTKNQCLAFSK